MTDFRQEGEIFESQETTQSLFKSVDDEPLDMDSLTIIWYLTTFTALLGFFVVMACTEKSCNRGRAAKPEEIRTCPPTPCPSYKNFAPPSYETVLQKYPNQIYIVPVHENNNRNDDIRNHTQSVRIDVEKEITTR